MATLHSPKACLPKLACSLVVAGLFTARMLIAGAYPHNHLINQLSNGHNQTNTTTAEPESDQPSYDAHEKIIQANNQALQQLDQTLARIEQMVQLNKNLRQRISRSPTATKTIQALEAAITIFRTTQTWARIRNLRIRHWKQTLETLTSSTSGANPRSPPLRRPE